MYATGIHSLQTVADEMNKSGILNAVGNPIGASRIEITLKSPFYYGGKGGMLSA